LREKAQEIEGEVRHSLQQQQQSMERMRPSEPSGPGEMYR
jgi:hypothetical protein